MGPRPLPFLRDGDPAMLPVGAFLNAQGETQHFVSGWTPEHESRGVQTFLASGRTFHATPHYADDNRPLPEGFSLSRFVRFPYDQGQVGSCFSNMMAAILQGMTISAVINGDKHHKIINPSRRLIWYQCRKLDGSLGSWGDGGSIVNSFRAVGEPPHGIGDCSEDEWPYRADHRWLEETPPESVIRAADAMRVEHIAKAPYHREQWQRSIFNTRPVGIGIWWPFGWDSECDHYGRTTGIGAGTFGHALAVIGWLADWDGHFWWQILNSHGPIYHTPDHATRQRIVGYEPLAGEKCYSFWAREDLLQRVFDGDAESYTAADVRGYVPVPVNQVPSMLDTFPV